MWDCKCGYMYVYGYTGYACIVCVIWWPQIDIYMCDMILCYDLRIDANVFRRGFERAVWLEFLHVVLNTTCNCIRCYVMWICVYMWITMWITHRFMWITFCCKCNTFTNFLKNIVFSCIFAHYLLLSLVYSYYLFFHHITIINYIVYTI